MTASYYLGVDVGSASVRAGLYANNGQRLSFAVRPIKQFHPKANFVEQSSADIWENICTVVKEAVATSEVDPAQIRSIGFDATCSLVACGENGAPVSVAEGGESEHDIIMWMDHRASDETLQINSTHNDALKYVGGEVSIEMELPKILWLKKNFPDRYKQVWRFFDLADYLVWRSTDADVASVCTLACKWNYLAHEQRFPEEMLKEVSLLDVLEKMPRDIIDVGKSAGTLTAGAAEQLGLHQGVIVAGGMIDAHAGGLALLGSEPTGSLAIISGTSNCHMIVSADAIFTPGVWGPYYGAMLPDFWLGEGGQSAAGSLVEWTAKNTEGWPELCVEADKKGVHPFALLNEWVTELEGGETLPTKNLHVLGDHHGNRSPRANPNARGLVSGLTLESSRSGQARTYLATLQAVAYGTRHIIEEMTACGHKIETLYICGGATKNPLWLREYANVTGRDIQLIDDDDPVTLGAAIVGAVACGDFANIPEACKKLVRRGAVINADPTTKPFHDAKFNVYLSLYADRERHQSLMDAANF